jgi:hypothetical protein
MAKHRLGLFSLTLFSTLGLATYAYLGSFTRMLADDFCSMGWANRLGLLRSVWFWYINWSGRYTAFASDWLIFRSILGPYKIYLLVPVTILCWLVFLFLTIYFLLQKTQPSVFLHAAALAGVFLFLVLLLSPDISQSLYWWNGMRSYALPLVVISFYFLLFQLFKQLNIPTLWAGLLGFLLLFLSGGLGETAAVAQTALLLFLIGLDLLKFTDRPRNEMIVLYASLAGAICSLVVIILSPGNKLRQAQLPPSPDIVTLLSISLQAYGKFLANFFSEPAGIPGLAGAFLAAVWIGSQYAELASSRGWLIPVCMLGGVLISFACFPPGVYGYSEPPPPRIDIIPVFFLVGGFLCSGFVFGSWLAGTFAFRWLDSIPFIVLIVLLMGFTSLTTISHLVGRRNEFALFAEKWDQVDAQILQARAENLKSINIPAMENWAGLQRPNHNRNYWPTQCYTVYYGIQVLGPDDSSEEAKGNTQ